MITQLNSDDASICSFGYDVLFSTQLDSAHVWFRMYSARICTYVCVRTQICGSDNVCDVCGGWDKQCGGLRINGLKNN